jgi:hypothetical protein
VTHYDALLYITSRARALGATSMQSVSPSSLRHFSLKTSYQRMRVLNSLESCGSRVIAAEAVRAMSAIPIAPDFSPGFIFARNGVSGALKTGDLDLITALRSRNEPKGRA